jgi:hypothetical protein
MMETANTPRNGETKGYKHRQFVEPDPVNAMPVKQTQVATDPEGLQAPSSPTLSAHTGGHAGAVLCRTYTISSRQTA